MKLVTRVQNQDLQAVVNPTEDQQEQVKLAGVFWNKMQLTCLI